MANVAPTTRTWTPMTAAQAQALGRIGGKKDTPSSMVIARGDDKELIVVPSSAKDRRRWDITKGGLIRRKER